MSDLITQPKLEGIMIGIVSEAVQMKNDALLCSKDVTSVDDGFEATLASKAQNKLRDLIKGIENSRKLAKAPILDMGRGIDAIAKDFIDDVKSEEARIAKMLGSFQKVEREKKIKAEKEAQELENNILIESAETALATGQDITQLDETAQVKIAKLRKAAALKHEAVNGVRLRTTIKFEIVDEAELLIGRPDLFSPDTSKINQALKINKNIHGLKVWEETKSY